MSKAVYICTLIVTLGVIIVISAARPELLGKENGFLENFVNHELINTMGVISAITLASASQIHLALNSIEERLKKRGLTQTRAGVRHAAYALIALLAASIVLVTVKPMLGNGASIVALCNGMSLFFLLFSVLLLLSLTKLVFAIPPIMEDEK